MISAIGRPKLRLFSLNAFCIALLLLASTPLMSQTVTQSFNVRLKDERGNAIPGATVTLTDKLSAEKHVAQTNNLGVATFEVKPGLYTIVVETGELKSPNYSIDEVEDVLVDDSHREIEFEIFKPLEGRRTTVFSAAAAAPPPPKPLEEETGEQISALLNLTNDLTPLLQVVTGAIATGPNSLGRVVFDGKGNDQLTVRLDGVDFTVLTDLPSLDASLDAVSSFTKPEVSGNLDTASPFRGTFRPLLGPGSGGVVDAQTYQGAASGWKAQFYGEHRNDAFNARNFFDYDGKNGLRRSRFGVKVGGPLDKHKRFLPFLGYDRITGRIERNAYEAIPADAICGCATGPYATLVQSFIPAGTSLVGGASLNPDFLIARRRNRTTTGSNAINLRLDYFPFAGDTSAGNPLKSKNQFTFRFTRQNAENRIPEGVTGREQRQRITFNNFLAGFLWLPNDKSIHTFKFGFNETRVQAETRSGIQSGPSLPDALLTTAGSIKTLGVPSQSSVPIASLGGLIKNVGRGFTLGPKSFSLGYDALLPVGERTELRLGFEGRFIRLDLDRLGGLTYAFPNVQALRASTPGSVTFLSDLSSPGPFSNLTGPRRASQNYYLGYLEFTMPIGQSQKDPTNGKDRSPLILTYGLRYDYFGALAERNNRAVSVDPQTGEILPPGTPFYRMDKLNFQPRFGLVYRLSKFRHFEKTVLRAGTGLYSGVPKTGDLLLPIDSDRFSTGMTGGAFPTTSVTVLNDFLSHPETRQFQPLAFARSYKVLERVFKWEAQLTHTIPGYDFGVQYAGNVGRNLPLANIANKIVRVTTNPDPTKPAIVVREFDIVQNGEVFKPFGEFFFRTGNGRSSYNAVTLFFKRNNDAVEQPTSLIHKATFGLNVQYTFSRNRGNTSGTVASNPFDFNADLGFNTADIPHNFRISAVYDLWKAGQGSKDDPEDLLLGWKIIPSLKMSSGLPLIVRLNRPDVVYLDASGNAFSSPGVGRNAIINTPGGGESSAARVPNLISGVNPYLRNGVEYLNPAAFSVPAPGEFGNLRRGQLRGPRIFQVDLGLRRNLFNFGEKKLSGQFQMDVFNVFNRANFLNPTAPLPGVLGTSTADNQIQPGMPFTRSNAGTFGVISAADIGRTVQFSLVLRVNDGFTR